MSSASSSSGPPPGTYPGNCFFPERTEEVYADRCRKLLRVLTDEGSAKDRYRLCHDLLEAWDWDDSDLSDPTLFSLHNQKRKVAETAESTPDSEPPKKLSSAQRELIAKNRAAALAKRSQMQQDRKLALQMQFSDCS